jgi:deoxyribonuclease V
VKVINPHVWNVDYDTAVRIQMWLRSRVVLADRFQEDNRVSNIVWCSSTTLRDCGTTVTHSSAVMTNWQELSVVGTGFASWAPESAELLMSGAEGIASFFTVPCIIEALKDLISKVGTDPDMIVCDQEGIAHTRRFGTACHLGVLTDKATFGVTTSTQCKVVDNKILLPPEEFVIENDFTRSIDFNMQNKIYEPVVGALVDGFYVSPGHHTTVTTVSRAVTRVIKKNPCLMTCSQKALATYINRR